MVKAMTKFCIHLMASYLMLYIREERIGEKKRKEKNDSEEKRERERKRR